MIDLKNVNLLSFQTAFMQKDPTTIALCAALQPFVDEIADQIIECLILPRVDELSEKVLDELAWQLHVDWYDATASLDVKRRVIKGARNVHMYRGTKYAVEQVVKQYFGDGEVKEWFEYGGQSYTFKVIVRNTAVSSELANQFTMAVNAVKNVRSVMDELVIGIVCSDTIYCSDSLIMI